MAFDFNKISYEIDQNDTNGRYAKVDIYYDDVLKGSVQMEPKDLIGTPDTVTRKIILASVPLAKELLGSIRYASTDPNLSLMVIDRRNALSMLGSYLTNKGTYAPQPEDGVEEFIAWMRTKFDTLTDAQIVTAMTG